MQTSEFYHGVVTGDGPTPYELPAIPAYRLERTRARIAAKGGLLTIRGQSALPPNPNPEPVKRNGSADLCQKYDSVKSEAKSRAGGRRATTLKAVVNLTTNTYYPSITDAALALGVGPANIGSMLGGRCKTVKGHAFRYATEEERKARKMIPTATTQTI